MNAKPTPIRRFPTAPIELAAVAQTMPDLTELTMKPYRVQQALYRDTLEMLAERAEQNAEYLHRLAATDAPLAAVALSSEFITQSLQRNYEFLTRQASTFASLSQSQKPR